MVADVIVSGVPQMLPLVVPNERPDGKVALMAHVVTSPPVLLGTTVEMVLSLVKAYVVGEYEGIGALRPTSNQICPLNDWPEMLAHIV